MPYLSLTSWSLHRSLGPLRMTMWDEQQKTQVVDEVPQPEYFQLVELPRLAAERGIRALDVCHFHFPDTSPDYLVQLRQAFADHDVTFYTLLADYGDISNADPDRRGSDIAWIQRWIDIASAVGAERVRVVAGDSDPADQPALRRSAEALTELATYAASRNVTVISENFRALSSTSDNCLYLHEVCDHLDFVCDFGNFKGVTKYDDLASILPFATSIHAKAHYDEQGFPDEAEFRRCLDLVQASAFDGPITLVYDSVGDEWAGIERIQRIVETYLELLT